MSGEAVQASRIYDGGVAADVTQHGSLARVFGGDAVAVQLVDAAYGDKNVETGKTVPGHYELLGGDARNYVLAEDRFNGAADITPRALTARAEDLSKMYGQGDPTLTWRIEGAGLVEGDHISGGLGREAGEAVGVYAIKRGRLNSDLTLIEGKFYIDSAHPEILLGEGAAAYRAAFTAMPSSSGGSSDSQSSSPRSVPNVSAVQLESIPSAALYTVENGGIRMPE